MTGGLNLASESAPLQRSAGVRTLVEESSFCLSDAAGDIDATRPEGLFVGDSRILSRWRLTIEGRRPDLLESSEVDPFSAVFVLRQPVDSGDGHVLIVRERHLLHGALREEFTVRNFSGSHYHGVFALEFGVDFADLFAVKEGRAPVDAAVPRASGDARIWRFLRLGDDQRGTEVWFSEPVTGDAGAAAVALSLPPNDPWELTVEIAAIVGGHRVQPSHPCGGLNFTVSPSQRLNRWRADAPMVTSDSVELTEAMRRSIDDLGALRIFDPDSPDRPVIAAGAPWFMTLFGRDSLLTSWMALVVDPDLGLAVLQTLARLQGHDVNPATEEEPGRILHEVRFTDADSLALGGGSIYYGTIDAAPLFVMLLAELRRWGVPRAEIDALVPAADRALQWISDFGDRDGDGYLEYQRHTDDGLANQGWKDSWDAIQFADGALAHPPIAPAEAQAYAYAAFLGRAALAQEAGDLATAADLRARADRLKHAFNRDFWVDAGDGGYLALGLDRDKRPIDAVSSNMGHALWCGILDDDKAEAVARRLVSDDLFSGWGVRTLSTAMAGYNPISYHCGSVWPHDTALIANGLMRYGFVDQALRVVQGLLRASSFQQGRLPELFSGLSNEDVPFPVGYPSSCSPQAWAAAAPLLCLRTLLRLDPEVPNGAVALDPVLPVAISRLGVHGIPIAGRRVNVTIEDGEASVEGLPSGIRLRGSKS